MIRFPAAMSVAGRLFATLCCLVLPTALEAQSWSDRVDAWVIDTAREGETEFLVYLAEQADLSEASLLSSKDAKGWFVYETLTELATRTQAPVLAELAELGAEHRSYWVANMIWVEGGMEVVERMASRPEVARVAANPPVAMDLPSPESGGKVPFPDVEPNIAHTGVPDVFWNAGVFGQGAVVAGADTGYDWDHPALIKSYRGSESGPVDHNYNWHDSIHSGGGVCGPSSPVPCDDNGHGTHTMGTMTGYDGGSNWVGMAPAARWIGCRNMNQGVGTPTTYSECFQWFIAPTDLNDENPDPSKAPHAINNSWLCPPSEGCTDPNVLQTVVENTRAAGIMVVASAGNDGSGCSSINAPAAIYDASFTVGATNNSDIIASFSSRGPVTVDGSNRLKPDISAPGVSVRSSIPGTGYTFLSGTSMAGPHVAGMTGLLVSAAHCWAGEIETLEEHMIDAALGRTTTQNCGGSGQNIPNNTYGYGALRSQLPAAGCPPQVTLTSGPWVKGTMVDLTVTGATPGQVVFFAGTLQGPGIGACPPIMGGLCTDLRTPLKVMGKKKADAAGTAVLTFEVPGQVEGNIYLQAYVPNGADSVSTNLVVTEVTE